MGEAWRHALQDTTLVLHTGQQPPERGGHLPPGGLHLPYRAVG